MKKFLTFLALACLMVTGAWANITSLDEVEEGAIYTLTCSRGSLTINSDKSKLASSKDAGTTFRATDENFQFQFKKSGDNYYLYSVGAAKYSQNDGTLVDDIADAAALTLYSWGNGKAQPRWDNDHNLNFGGASQLAIGDWKTGDPGNDFAIAKVETLTYTVTITGADGAKITYNGAQYGNGNNLTGIGVSPSEIIADNVDGYFPASVTVNGNAINVTYKAYPFQAANSFANIQHWYVLNVHSNKTHYIYTDNQAITFNDNELQTADAYAWGFVGNNTNGYVIYNKATGESVALDSADPCAMTTDGLNTHWTIYESNQTTEKGLAGFCIKTGSQQYVNYQNNELKRWSANDAGSTFTPYEITTYTVHITNAPAGQNPTVTFKTNEPVSDGGSIVAVGLTKNQLIASTIEGYDVNITIEGTTITVAYTQHVVSFPDAGTYYVTLTNKDTNNHPYIYNALSESTYTLQSATSGSTNNFIWKVVSDGAGNITSIINGDGRGVGVNGQYKGRVTSLQYKDKGDGYYYLTSSVIKNAQNDHECLNRSNNPTYFGSNGIRTVTTWKGENNADNQWKVETVEAASVYTVEITGAENAYVTIGSEYAYDGGFFLAETITKENVQPSEVTGHEATVTIEGKTIKVVYTQSAQERTITFHLGAPANTTKEVKLYDGETPTADAIGITLPAGVTATPEPAFATVSGDATYTITFTDNNTYPFQTGKFYNLAFNRDATKPVHIYVNGTAIDTRDTDHSYVDPTYSTQDYYKWSIDGDWYHGFTWKNKGADKYVSYGSANPSDKYTATLVDAADAGSYFDYIANNGYNYFKLHGTTNNAFISNNGGTNTTFLTNWNAAGNIGDAGAQIIITEATDIPEPATVTYTVTSITGAEGKVIYNEHEYGVNDSFVAGNDLQSSNLSATPVEGYEYTITIDGSYNITLEYVSSSPIVARMADFVSAGTNNGATDITANYNVVEGGAVYSFEDNGYIGAISNPALAKLLNDGNKVITVAAWVYGNPTGGTFFGYGGQQNGVMLKDNSGSLQATWKGADDVQAQDGALADDQWNLVAYSFKSGVGCRYIISSGFYTRVNSAKMVTPPSVEQLFAVGSGNQEKARDCFNGILANLTIIKSDGQLNDSQVKEYIGAAPTAKETGLDITIGETRYATFYDAVNRAIPEGVKAYYCNYNEGTGNLDTKDITEVTGLTYIPASVGVVLEGEAGTYTFNEVEDRYEEDEDALLYIYFGEDGLTNPALRGTVEETTLDQAKAEYGAKNIYVLSKVNNVIGFYKYGGETLGAHKAFYAPENVATEINGFALDFGGQTVGVNTVISATNLKAGFDIQGRRINKMQKGINILNGKKIIK